MLISTQPSSDGRTVNTSKERLCSCCVVVVWLFFYVYCCRCYLFLLFTVCCATDCSYVPVTDAIYSSYLLFAVLLIVLMDLSLHPQTLLYFRIHIGPGLAFDFGRSAENASTNSSRCINPCFHRVCNSINLFFTSLFATSTRAL